ncbi:MAG: glutaredoxin family protein [Nitrospirae bacterium]|nr:glutaredoxin family protein [Nitrospirota bacterium]
MLIYYTTPLLYKREKIMVRLTFYLKEGCWLCDAMQETINGLTEKYGLRVTKVHIDSSDELYEMYRFDIPVLEFKDGSTLHGHIKKKDLLRKLDENEAPRRRDGGVSKK